LADLVATVSIISSVASITLAIFAIWFSMRVDERLKTNFLRLKKVMDDNHERTKEVLADIDREADAIKSTVYKSQSELQKALENIIDECNISENHQEEK
jgi:hypothetical protein